LDFAFEAGEHSILAWYLRDFERARRLETWDDASTPSDFLVTTQQEPPFPEGATYAGQRFAIRYAWDSQSLRCRYQWPPQCQSLTRWLLLRRARVPLDVQDEVTLWRRVRDED
jgi:hypothetical protein